MGGHEVLKARYYPRCDFLKADLGSRPSYIWSSIWSAMELIDKGYGWRVNSRECINILDNPWLPGPGDGRQLGNSISVYRGHEVDNSWKHEVLNGLFDAEMVNRICSIPLSQTRLLDKIVWRCDGFGNYSAKSGYRVLCAEQADTQHGDFSAFFTTLWDINVPAKFKITMWRIVNNFIPTFQNLQIRRLQVTNVCPFFQSVSETIEHLMRDCVFVQQLMRKLELPAASIQVKVSHYRVVGRNSLVLIMASCSIQHEKVADAFMVEALACRQAVVFARELGLSRMIIEGDSLTVIKKLNSDVVDRSLICPIVHDIKILSKDFSIISLCFVRRGANKAAHALSHEYQSNLGPCYLVEWRRSASLIVVGWNK
ncbi:hypothetical protein V6N11_030672 [Hibiscus sabdariffa]|uniref:RNase H type-1 domain-containing protein n=1 Tax=Hibiscus sabdariffa TaxID=183260 RepID=A0ABR2NME7_9ROSI